MAACAVASGGSRAHHRAAGDGLGPRAAAARPAAQCDSGIRWPVARTRAVRPHPPRPHRPRGRRSAGAFWRGARAHRAGERTHAADADPAAEGRGHRGAAGPARGADRGRPGTGRPRDDRLSHLARRSLRRASPTPQEADMARIQAGSIAMNYVEHGSGNNVVLAVHGNLGCANWLDLATPLLPADVRVIAAEWRGCGASDKPQPAADYANYAMEVHARDHLALLDALGIDKCHVYAHSTGGIIVSHMLALAPERFRKVLLLDPVTPVGLQLAPGQVDVLTAMKTDADTCFAGLASAAPTLFRPETLQAGPQFAQATYVAQRVLFRLLVEKTRVLSDGVWFGTPHNLARE